MRARFPVTLTVLVLACGLFAGPALAWKSPTAGQKRAITQAVLSAIPRSVRPKIQVKGIRVTSVRLYGIDIPPFASANEVPKPPYEDTVQGQQFVVQQVPTATGGWRWVTVSYGSAFVGCGVVPPAYLRDLTGDRTPCSS
jgi:hypothetical protein